MNDPDMPADPQPPQPPQYQPPADPTAPSSPWARPGDGSVPPSASPPSGPPFAAGSPPADVPPPDAPGYGVPPAYGPPPVPGQPWSAQQGYGPQPYGPQGYGPGPQGYGPPPKKRVSKWLIPAISVFAAVLLGCFGTGVWLVVRASNNVTSAVDDTRVPSRDRDPLGADPTPEESVSTEPAGPKASTYPVREDDDLAKVCDETFYPTSPKFAGKAPHQISVGLVDTKDLPSRYMKPYVDVPYSLSDATQKAWMPKDPAKSQLMACVDLVSTGAEVKKCSFDDPTPSKVSLRRATYQLRLFEVATGKKLLDKKISGDDAKCPTVVFVTGDNTIFTKPDDRSLYELLRGYVNKK